jgi:hypothetical protein
LCFAGYALRKTKRVIILYIIAIPVPLLAANEFAGISTGLPSNHTPKTNKIGSNNFD